jgi:hypothetical protein
MPFVSCIIELLRASCAPIAKAFNMGQKDTNEMMTTGTQKKLQNVHGGTEASLYRS